MPSSFRRSGFVAPLHALRLLERGLLGCGLPDARRAVDEALVLAGDAAWCMRCGVPLSDAPCMPIAMRVGQGPRCAACVARPRFDAFIRLGSYRAPLDGLVRRAKEHAWHAALAQLGWRLGDEVHRRLQMTRDGVVVVPIPTSPWRRLRRGTDHANELALGVAARLQLPHVRALHMGGFARQAGLGRRERLLRAGRMVLRARAAVRVKGCGVLLVDDIRTTGATLDEARRLLEGAGAAWVVPSVACVAEIS